MAWAQVLQNWEDRDGTREATGPISVAVGLRHETNVSGRALYGDLRA